MHQVQVLVLQIVLVLRLLHRLHQWWHLLFHHLQLLLLHHLLPISQVIPLGFPPNFSHSIFSAQVIDRQRFKSNSWIINTGGTDHMVHSVSQLTTITSIVHSCVYLPNGEKDIVTHIGTMQISSTLTLTNVLCVPSFSFNLISVSKLTQTKLCCLIFLGDSCFI